jgi:hypothetical protein
MGLFFRFSVIASLFFSRFAFADIAPAEESISDISPDVLALNFIKLNWPWIILAIIAIVIFARYVSKGPK